MTAPLWSNGTNTTAPLSSKGTNMTASHSSNRTNMTTPVSLDPISKPEKSYLFSFLLMEHS